MEMVKALRNILLCTVLISSMLGGGVAVAQDAKTLEQQASKAEGSDKLSLLILAAQRSLQEDKEKKCLQLTEDAIELSDELLTSQNNSTIIRQKALALHLQGKVYSRLGKDEDAIESLSQSLDLYDQVDDLQGQESVLESIEGTQTPQKESPKWWQDIKNEMNSWELGKKYQDKKRDVIIGYFEKNAQKYEEEGDLLRATEYYLKTIRWYEDVGDSLKVLDTYQHVAELFLEMGNIEAAEATLRYVESLEPRLSDTIDTPIIIEQPPVEIKLDTPFVKNNSLITIPDTLPKAQKKPLETTSGYGQQLLEEIKKIQPDESERKELIAKRNEYQKLANDLTKKGDYKTALKYYQLYIAAQEKLLELSRKRLFDSLRASYQIEAKAEQIGELQMEKSKQSILLLNQQAELDKQTHVRRFLLAITIILLVASTVSYKLFIIKRRAHKELGKTYEDLDEAHHQLKSAQTAIVQSEKMASLGQLTTGIAHELNNPINFVSANVIPLRRDIEEIKELLAKYGKLLYSDDPKAGLAEVEAYKKEIDLEFLTEEIESLLMGMEEGAKRTREIVNGLRNFSRLDEESPKTVDLHEGLDSTLILLKNKIKNHINIEKKYDPALQTIECFPGPINQVFMNILANAIHAIEDSRKQHESAGKITIETISNDANVLINISDTGCGMSQNTQQRIFEPFYTTKDVGRGTGLGLSIAYGIIKNHNGEITVDSHIGEGTTFRISLPKQQPLEENTASGKVTQTSEA
ncbi:ATP-binding protein [Flammeovirgaceae bacterium SG7u.111]|nr:ATP-binding protein [Flammeovirgaceae bacterium SG7u.132]WPO36342.1 ATP-binding protein [Flammeovirgaceae bacterium SG7u.111]